jgi:hypothetical protein
LGIGDVEVAGETLFSDDLKKKIAIGCETEDRGQKSEKIDEYF